MREGMRLVAVALLLALPVATAGSASDPELADPRGDVSASNLDLLSAWFVAEEEGLRFSIRTADGSLPDRFPDSVYWVTFRVGTQTASAAVGFGDDGRFRGYFGPLRGSNWNAGGFETVANGALTGLRESRGTPSTWSGVVPWGSVPGLEPGATIETITAGTAFYDRRSSAWAGSVDTGRTEQTYVAQAPADLLPIVVPRWVIPLIVLGCTLAGAATGYALVRWRRAARASPSPPPSPSSPSSPRQPHAIRKRP